MSNKTLKAVILDKTSGKPIANADVYQVDYLNAYTTSDENGLVRHEINTEYKKSVFIKCENYIPKKFPLNRGFTNEYTFELEKVIPKMNEENQEPEKVIQAEKQSLPTEKSNTHLYLIIGFLLLAVLFLVWLYIRAKKGKTAIKQAVSEPITPVAKKVNPIITPSKPTVIPTPKKIIPQPVPVKMF